jgi:hypothetical protein
MIPPDPAAVLRYWLAAQRWGAERRERRELERVRLELENLAFRIGHDEEVGQQAVDDLVRLAVRCGWLAGDAYPWIVAHMRRGAYVALLEAWLADADGKVSHAV